jgi:hypothetical protein
MTKMNKRMWLTGFATILGIGAAAWAQEKAAKETVIRESKVETARDEESPVFVSGSREAASDLLRQRVASVNWNGATFEEVLDWVKDQGEGRVNVVPKWGPLGVESVTRENTIDLQLNNTNIADVLNEVLEQLSEDGQIQYRGIGNKLTISTKQDFERTMYVRVYDITDMLFRVENFGDEAPLIDLKKNASTKGGGTGQSVFQGGGSGGQKSQSTDQLEQQNEERLKKLRELIEQTIAPETWDLSGSDFSGGGSQAQTGGLGRIRVLNNSLVVRNTIEVHEMIAGAFVFGK